MRISDCSSDVCSSDHLMMAATLADGETVLENAAREPEVVDLANCLRAMGAKIEGDGTTTIRIRGVTALHAATHAVMPDRIETGSYLVAGAVTRGRVRVNKTDPAVMDAVFVKMQPAGATIQTGTVFGEGELAGKRH